MRSPSPKTRVGRRVDCTSDGRASTLIAVKAAPRLSPAKTTSPVSRPTWWCGVSPIRRPARTPSRAVMSANASGAMVTVNGSAAPGKPLLAAMSGSRVNRMSTPCPSNQMSTAARQNTIQSMVSPYWIAHNNVSGTNGIPMPTPTTSSASSAANRAVSRRFMTRRPYPDAGQENGCLAHAGLKGARITRPGWVPPIRSAPRVSTVRRARKPGRPRTTRGIIGGRVARLQPGPSPPRAQDRCGETVDGDEVGAGPVKGPATSIRHRFRIDRASDAHAAPCLSKPVRCDMVPTRFGLLRPHDSRVHERSGTVETKGPTCPSETLDRLGHAAVNRLSDPSWGGGDVRGRPPQETRPWGTCTRSLTLVAYP